MSVASTTSRVDRCCAACWDARHKCNGPGIGRCQDCISYLKRRGIIDEASIEYAAHMDTTALSEHLFQNPYHGSLYTWGDDSSTSRLRIASSQGSTIQFFLELSGPFLMQSEHIRSIDGLARQFSAKVSAKGGSSQLVSTSALIGGYLHLICSVIRATEHTNTSRDGFQVDNDYNGYNIEARFKYILICRVQKLMNEVMDANRLHYLENKDMYTSSHAYAAAVILRRELNYFKGNIKSGGLHESAYTGFQRLLSQWFDSVDQELLDRIREGCGRFPNWRSSVIQGSMKKVRRHGETLTIDMHLHLSQYTVQSRSPPISLSLNLGSETALAAMPNLMVNPSLVVNNDFDDLNHLIFDVTQSGEISPATPSQEAEMSHQFCSDSSDSMNFALQNSYEFPSPEISGSTSDLSEATIDPRYLSTANWYPGTFNF